MVGNSIVIKKDGTIDKKVLYNNCWKVLNNSHRRSYYPKNKLSEKEFNVQYKKAFDLRFNELWDWYNKDPHNRHIRLGDLGNLNDAVLGEHIKYSVWVDQYRFKNT
mgnify:CR=1 FL=1|tara:strand:+ start:226 stop:543 length:318 start_codon:yes stop_codon:yes gene_type:complete